MTITHDSVAAAPRRGVARGLASVFGKWRPARFGLRTRIMSMFVVGALFLSTFLAAVAYSFTRSSLLNQRTSTSTEQAYRNARVAQREISTGSTNNTSLVVGMTTGAAGQLTGTATVSLVSVLDTRGRIPTGVPVVAGQYLFTHNGYIDGFRDPVRTGR